MVFYFEAIAAIQIWILNFQKESMGFQNSEFLTIIKKMDTFFIGSAKQFTGQPIDRCGSTTGNIGK